MNFKYKNFLQQVFSKIVYGEKLNYLFQKHVSKRLPLSNQGFLEKVNLAKMHYDKFTTYNTLEFPTKKYYEFGAGWDLVIPITFNALGFNVTCIDIRELVFNELITNTIKKFVYNKENLPFKCEPEFYDNFKADKFYTISTLESLLDLQYLAPLDARNTGFAANSFDLITSSVTFEHIPQNDLQLILEESYRILKPGGILSVTIDYQDHWSYFDKNITIYNYLKFSDKEWIKYNPSLHYQNRLRHKDYLDIVAKTKFIIVEETIEKPTDNELKSLKNLQINEKFLSYTLEELAIKESVLVLRK